MFVDCSEIDDPSMTNSCKCSQLVDKFPNFERRQLVFTMSKLGNSTGYAWHPASLCRHRRTEFSAARYSALRRWSVVAHQLYQLAHQAASWFVINLDSDSVSSEETSYQLSTFLIYGYEFCLLLQSIHQLRSLKDLFKLRNW